MTIKETSPVQEPTLAELITELENSLKHSTQGIWQKGQTTHDTVTETGYKIGSFHHADDASFADIMHLRAKRIIAELNILVALQQQNKPNPST